MRKNKLSKSCRMTERHQFVRLFDKPESYSSQIFQAYWKKNTLERSRLGITIKGKLPSVWRVRIKRIVREWFRTRKEDIGAVDINLVIRIPRDLNWVFVDKLRLQMHSWKIKL